MLKYHPKIGEIVLCDYKGFNVPEMVKIRPVIIISPRYRGREGLVTVVPLSTTKPDQIMPWHVEIMLEKPLSNKWLEKALWVKADMLCTVAFRRLDRLHSRVGERRKYFTRQLSDDKILQVREAVLGYLGHLPQ